MTRQLLTADHYARLEAACELPRRDPVRDLSDPDLSDLLARTEILLTSWGAPRLDADALARLPRLRLVAHAAGTVRDLVSDELWRRSVRVTSAADANAVPVAEYTLAAILMANKRAFRLQRWYHEHRTWQLWDDVAPGLGNFAKTVGIVGASRIGRRVIELLRPHDLEVIVSDPYLDDKDARSLGAEPCELDELMRRSDVVSLHAPSLPETRNMIDRRRLGLLRDGAVLVNTARGALVDHEALTDELTSGRIDAVLDVTEPEILPEQSPLYDLPNVFLTPHIAGSQGTETQRMADLAISEIERFTRGDPLLHEVVEGDMGRIA